MFLKTKNWQFSADLIVSPELALMPQGGYKIWGMAGTSDKPGI